MFDLESIDVVDSSLTFELDAGEPLIFWLDDDRSLTVELAAPLYIGGDIYNGQVVVEPTFESTTLSTKNKVVKSDILVNPIRVEQTTNESGGITVYIGGI